MHQTSLWDMMQICATKTVSQGGTRNPGQVHASSTKFRGLPALGAKVALDDSKVPNALRQTSNLRLFKLLNANF